MRAVSIRGIAGILLSYLGVCVTCGAWPFVAAAAEAPSATATKDSASPESTKAVIPTYNRDVAPILWKNCAGCHRQGEIGPFPLLTYTDAAKRAEFLAEITAQRRMPPWKPEPGFGKFHDERRLSEAQIATIAAWAKAGAPEGDASDLGQQPKFTDGWQLGEPDLVLKMSEAHEIPADGRDIYRCFVIPIPIAKDMMVSAVEFRPGNPKVVHHAIMFLDANRQGRKKDGADGKPGFASFGAPGIVPTGGLGTWVPGCMPRELPDGIARYLKQGSDLVLQLHYHPIGKPESDQSSVGLYFAKKPTRKIVTGIVIVQPELRLPADNAACPVACESDVLPVDVYVLGVMPHMHNLGREFKVTAIDPSGAKVAPMIWIKDWDFNWQGSYQFAKPMRLPKGSKIKVEAVYDNSAANPKNPNSPPKEVRWGEQTRDEMCLCGIQVFTDTLADLRKVAEMRGNAMGPGMEGGAPGHSKIARRQAEAGSPFTSERPPFPADGLPIAEKHKALLSSFDANQDGKLSEDEADRLPRMFREHIDKHLRSAAKEKAGKSKP